MPDSATVGIPLARLRLRLARTFALLFSACLCATASAATTLTASTLLIAPEYRLPETASPRPAKLAIVIDDVGYNLARGERLLALPKELTLGVLPYAPFTREIARQANRAGREIILHQPMEPLEETQREPGTLELRMTATRFDAALGEALARLPEASGVNNHTGSLLTARREPMERLMGSIARRGLYFLDSRTTPDSVAESTARAYAVPTIRRDVFLDHVRTTESLAAAFEQSLEIARRRGHAVVIAHPYDITLDFLEHRLARLPADVELISLGALVEPLSRPPVPDRRALALHESPASRYRSPDR
ncbi:MAG TPA: divergent polysaccharide deacetylase family protein [Pseudomonadales bacterium]